jgi:hypothetical protein
LENSFLPHVIKGKTRKGDEKENIEKKLEEER